MSIHYTNILEDKIEIYWTESPY